MPNLRQIVLNGNAGAFVDILATVTPTRWEAMEDEAAATTGLQVKTALDNFATTNTFSFGSEPIQSRNFTRDAGRVGTLLGLPAQGVSGAFNARAADKLASMRSNAAGGTTVRFIEYE